MKFTAEQITKIKATKTAEELTEDELDNVSGGGCSEPKPKWYIVAPGDCLALIASRYHTTPQALFKANEEMLAARGIYSMKEFNANLKIGEKILIGW